MLVKLSTFANGKWYKYHYKSPGPAKRHTIGEKTKQRIFKEQKGLCMYCNKKLHQKPADFDFDHIIPVKFGGLTCRSNIQILCVRCHRSKSGREMGLSEVTTKRPAILVSTTGKGESITPQHIRTMLFDNVRDVKYCIDFGKQPQRRITTKNPNPITLFFKRKNNIQTYFSSPLSDEQIGSYNKAPRQIFNILTITNRGTTELVKDHEEIDRIDKNVVKQLSEIIQTLGYDDIWDRKTRIPRENLVKVDEKVSLLDAKCVRYRGNSTISLLKAYMANILGISLSYKQVRSKEESSSQYILTSIFPEWDPEEQDKKEVKKGVLFSYSGKCAMSRTYKDIW